MAVTHSNEEPSASTVSLSKQKNTIEVSTEYLKSLHASMNELRNEVYSLRKQTRSLSSNLHLLQQSSGVKFLRFPLLPIEIRTEIWKHALRSPQVVVMGENKIGRSKINSIMQTCRHAREIGLAFHFPVYRPTQKDQVWKQHLNLENDTIWLEGTPSMPEIQLICETCPVEGSKIFPDEGLIGHPCPHAPQLRCLAMNWSCWEDPQDVGYGEMEDTGSAKILWQLGVRELYIVVGEAVATGELMVFIEPRNPPWKLLLHMEAPPALPGLYPPREPKMAPDWELAARRQEKILEEFKISYEVRRRTEIEVASLSSSDTDDFCELEDLTGWKIPVVRFVEAVPKSSPWLFLSKADNFWGPWS